MADLKLCLLGPPRLERDGVPLKFDTRKIIALVAYLAVTGERHTREALLALLWPELPPDRGRAVLRRNLSVLRKALDEEWLAVDGEMVGLDPDAEAWIDVEQFRRRLAACETHGHSPSETCPDCLPLLEEAAGLYQDHFLAGFTLRDSLAFDEWQFFQTEGLRDELAGALVRLATYQTSQGDFEAAIEYARRWLALDPLNEPAHRHLMVLYAQSGQRAAALRQYESCRQLLMEELGVEPSAKIQETYDRLLEGELIVGPSAVEAILERELRSVGECPYRGLAPFRETDAPFFFGRETFTERLGEAVRTRPLVAVIVGSSGSGKSSTVFAGLLPDLGEQGDWLIASLRPGAQPFHALAAALIPALEPELDETDRLAQARKLAEALSGGEFPLHDVVGRALEKSGEAKRLLLVMDQFEELYTLCPQPETRRRFLDALLAAVAAVEGRRESPFVLLLTMRADFMGQALAYRPFADALQEASLMLGPMTREELRAAIEKPAKKQGATFDVGLVERLLDDVGQEPGNLPLLEFALTLLWERLDFGWMTHAAYEEIGRVEGALARYAQQVYDELEEGDREGAQRVFVQLVQPGEGTEDTRRVATRAELGPENWPLVQHLADKRLVVTGRDAAGIETVEVVHEALIQRWGQLRAWMEGDRAFRTWQERLRGALRQWEARERDEGGLLRGVFLGEAEGWLAERGAELSLAEEGYIQASVDLRERRAAERDRQRRRIIVGLATGLVIAGALAIAALLSSRQATLNADLAAVREAEAVANADLAATRQAEAVQEREVAQAEAEARAAAEAVALEQREEARREASIGLGSQALLELEGPFSERAVLLALEALEHYPYTPQAERALGQAVLGGKLRLILRHEDSVVDVQWSPDGTLILTASYDGTAKVWDASTGEEILTFPGHHDMVLSAAWSPAGDHILTASRDQTARVWDVATGEELLRIAGHSERVLEARWSPDGSRILTASYDGTAKVWDASASSPTYGEELLTLSGHEGPVWSATWSPLGDRIVTGDGTPMHDDGTARVWDTTTGAEILVFSGHNGDVDCALWSPDGSRIVTAGVGGIARVWDAATGEEILVFSNHEVDIYAAAQSPDGSLIVTVGRDTIARVWDSTTGEEILTLRGHTADPKGIAWSPDGSRIATASNDGTAKVWDLDPALLTIAGPPSPSVTVVWSPEGDRVARAFSDNPAQVWDAVTGEEIVQLLEHGLIDIAWSPSGDRILTARLRPGTIKVWDADTGEELVALLGHSQLYCAQWSPDGTRIVSAGWCDNTARIWDADTGAELFVFTHDSCVYTAIWSPDGTMIVSSSDDGTARIWDAATGQVIRNLYPEGFQHYAYMAMWSPDGTRIATWGGDGIGRVWDVATGEEMATFSGHTGDPWWLAWSPTGERILTGGGDGTARVWDASTGAELLRYEFGSGLMAAWSPDGSRIAVASTDGMLRVLPTWQTTQGLIDYAKECCVVRELTAEEREQFGLPPR